MDILYRNLNRGNCFSLASGKATRNNHASLGKVIEHVTSGTLTNFITNNPASIKHGAEVVIAKKRRTVFAYLGGTYSKQTIDTGKRKLIGRLSIDFKIGAFVIDSKQYTPNNKHIAIIDNGNMFIYTK